MSEKNDSPRMRWIALAFIALAQLTVLLDGTIVNVALPAAQRDLGISDNDRQWVITAFTLAFGGLLLLGGRIADLAGRKRTFVIGLSGFAAASVLGGAAVNTAMLLTARALQGAFSALVAPAALSLLTVTFTRTGERAKAFGVFSAIAGAGGGMGLILGGAVTQYLDWRWSQYIIAPLAVVAALGAMPVIHEPPDARNRDRLDIPGVLLATTGLVSLVYGFTRAASDGWGAGVTVGLLVAAAVLLTAFVLVESRTGSPLLPLRVVTERNRAGVYLSLGLSIIGMFGLFLFLTYYLQAIKGFSPVLTGLAFLPMIVGMIVGSTQIGTLLMTRVSPRVLITSGLLVAAVGMTLLTQLKVDSSYLTLVLPAQLLLGLGMGTALLPATNLATEGVEPRDAGVASAMLNTAQQIGGSIGTALLNTIAASATHTWLVAHHNDARLLGQANVHGYATAIWWAVGILVLSAATAAAFLKGGRRSAGPVPVATPSPAVAG